MSVVFLEKAFWGFLGLVAALITVIYRLFATILNSRIENIEKKLIETTNKKNEEFREMEKKMVFIEKELLSLKNHETKHSELQIKLMKEISKKIDTHAPHIWENLGND